MMGTMKSIVLQAPTAPVIRACDACRKRKRKCSGEAPCTYCIQKGITCSMAAGRKRGPLSKKHKTEMNELVTTHCSIISNEIQEAMNKLHQQNTLVDFYFQFIGRGVPSDCRLPLSSPPSSDALTAQMCIISAHVMRFFGNNTLETQYIQEARRHVNSILDCDTLDSAIALIMMSTYLGPRPKGSFYATIAYNITKLPEVNTSWLAHKLQKAAQAMSISFDKNIPHLDRCMFMLKELPDVRVLDNSKVTDVERVKVSQCRLASMLLVLMQMDVEDTPRLLQSFSNPPISVEQKETVLQEIRWLDSMQAQLKEGIPGKIAAKFCAHLMSVLVFCRSGDTLNAFPAAITGKKTKRKKHNNTTN
eukprot:Phypoly_transcript_07161.p1 GENE.Phypoly_transcript_07161~~Phypoly_transcript_07161.p1  ORF type:complete len:361 (+),score=46.21 Phypoly_transcript_07161:149-1231(+)